MGNLEYLDHKENINNNFMLEVGNTMLNEPTNFGKFLIFTSASVVQNVQN